MSRMRKKGDLPRKTCVRCGRVFVWRRKWARDWYRIKYCSKACRSAHKSIRAGDGVAK
ncbi:DUF2256 domain-containing protein [Salinisphaera sp.]|uniref:DUF2256 domain-containing protein n=1 Tax=Salinisphaera sp. TaxID=1914330 RepID=UPI0032C210B4